MLEILATYESVSGQQINQRKTSLFFSNSTTQGKKKTEIKGALGVLEILHYDTYLGLPSLIGRHKKASFDYIKE